MERLSVGARCDFDSLMRGPCWPHPPNACTQTAVPSPSDIGIERCLFHPVPHNVTLVISRGQDGKACRGCTARLGVASAGTLLATPTKCKHSNSCAITIRHRNRALSFTCSPPQCDAWRLTRSRWKGFPWVAQRVGTCSSGDPAGHTHQMQALKQLCHHHQTWESSAVFSIHFPTL